MNRKQGTMTAKQFYDALRRLKLSVYAAAPVLGISLRQAQRYSAGETAVPLTVSKLLRSYLEHGLPRSSPDGVE